MRSGNALSAGRCRRITVAHLLCPAVSLAVLPAARAQTKTVAATSSALYYSPSNWITKGGDRISSNPGAYVKFGVKIAAGGAGALSLDLDTSIYNGLVTAGGPNGVNIATDKPYLAWSIDGGAQQFGQIPSSGVLSIGAGLSPGTHQVEAWFRGIKQSDNVVNRWNPGLPLYGISLAGVTIDDSASLLSPSILGHTTVIFGDSITEGVEAYHTGTGLTVGQDATNTWAQQVAANYLDAEAGIVGFAGTGWSQGLNRVPALVTTDGNGGAWQSILKGNPRSLAGVDYILVNDGRNDGNLPTDDRVYDPATDTGWLKSVRAADPNAWIFVIRPFSGVNAGHILNGFDAYRQSYPEDHHIAYIDISDLYTPTTLHPSQAEQNLIGAAVGERIKAAIQAEAPEPGTAALAATVLLPAALLRLRRRRKGPAAFPLSGPSHPTAN
jgi:hypothetical protein